MPMLFRDTVALESRENENSDLVSIFIGVQIFARFFAPTSVYRIILVTVFSISCPIITKVNKQKM